VKTPEPEGPGAISPAILARVQAAVEDREGRLKSGEWYVLCPAHGDHNPSARWNPGKAVWHCDVCGTGGGALDLARRLGLGRPHPTRLTDGNKSLAPFALAQLGAQSRRSPGPGCAFRLEPPDAVPQRSPVAFSFRPSAPPTASSRWRTEVEGEGADSRRGGPRSTGGQDVTLRIPAQVIWGLVFLLAAWGGAFGIAVAVQEWRGGSGYIDCVTRVQEKYLDLWGESQVQPASQPGLTFIRAPRRQPMTRIHNSGRNTRKIVTPGLTSKVSSTKAGLTKLAIAE